MKRTTEEMVTMDLVLPQNAGQSNEIGGDGGYQQKSRDFIQSGNFEKVR